MKKLKHKKLIITLSVIAGVLIAAVAAFFIYTAIYYKANGRALAALEGGEGYTVTEFDGNIVFTPDESATAALIFYPGGKVEHKSYAPLMAKLAQNNVLCVLLKVPLRLAIFDINAADGVKERFPDIEDWYVGGHSLGGAMAAKYVKKHGGYKGLFLLGAYSTEDLSSRDLKVISLYGSEDGVMNRKKYNSNLKNLPESFFELVIEGGCHAYFGDYGKQKGDGNPLITPEEQQAITVQFFIDCI